MKLFTDNEDHTPEGMQFCHEVHAALAPLFDKWAANGASLRQLSYLAQSEVTMVELSRLVSQKRNKVTK